MIKSSLVGILLLIVSFHSGVTTEARSPKTITFEGVLLANSPYPNVGCGGVWFHQLARYRVERVLRGTYTTKEAVVDHAACWGDVFQDIPVGSRVRLTVMVRKNYHTITTYPGIREIVDVENLSDAPRVFYVSLDAPQKVSVKP